MTFITTVFISTLLTISLIPVLKDLALRFNALDLPNSRKIHVSPMPKIGGIAMAAGTLLPIFLWAPRDHFAISLVCALLIIILFGIADDIKNLSYKAKFAGQITAALIVIILGGVKITHLGNLLPEDMLLPNIISIPLTLIVIVGVTNAINLADGLDGLAGGITLLSFICIGYLAYSCGDYAVLLCSVAITGAIFGFLRFNTYPATVFMGDSGSQLLGFLAVTLSLSLTQNNIHLSPLLPLILLGFPILDTFTVMAERISNGKSPFIADNNHFHHKLLKLGFFHTEAVSTIYIIQGLLVISAYTLRFYSEWFLLFVYLIFSGLIMSGFIAAEKKGWKTKRYHIIDKVIKSKLRILKDKNLLIISSFKGILFAIPALLIINSIIPQNIPEYVTLSSIGLAVISSAIWPFRKEWLINTIRISLYLFIPFTVYLSQAFAPSWFNKEIILLYNLLYVLIFFFVVVTLKFTKRQTGFKSTPMDFLIIFIVLTITFIPDATIRSHHIGLFVVKILVLFFSYEVLIAESRGRHKLLGFTTITAFLLIAIRGSL